tara:strand:+ start:164 stop:730 length:567 start_codon:yes stop_codon:yes gene_type:complete
VLLADTNGNDSMTKITVSGHPGSGTTTLVNLLEKELGWRSINGGMIFRNAAKKNNMSLVDYAELCLIDDKIDRELDDELIVIMKSSNGPQIIESRLAGHWAKNNEIPCKRIWLNVNEDIRAQRVQKREGGELAQVLFSIKQRIEKDNNRFKKFYNLSLDDMSPYSLTIDCNHKTPEEILKEVLRHLQE